MRRRGLAGIETDSPRVRLCVVVRQPLRSTRRIGKILLVEHFQTRLVTGQLGQHRVGAGAGQARIEQFDHHIDVFHALGDGFLGQVHVTGKPLDGHRITSFALLFGGMHCPVLQPASGCALQDSGLFSLAPARAPPIICMCTTRIGSLQITQECPMKPVSELLKRRESAPWHTTPETSVFDALQLLAQHEVGALMVMTGPRLVGVVSERDYTRKVALLGRNSREVTVADIMTADVLTVTPETRTNTCMALMSQRRIRHLPVMQDGEVIGMISIRDLMDDIIADHEQTIQQLTSYIQS